MSDDRERFLAFAFANADVLLQVDEALHVTYASGATNSLIGAGQTALIGMKLADLVTPTDRLLVTHLLQGLKVNQRLEPVIIHLGRADSQPTPVVLGGYRLPGKGGEYYLTVTKARMSHADLIAEESCDPETGLVEKEAFASLLEERASAARAIGADSKLTLLKVEQLSTLLNDLGSDAAHRLLGEIGAALRASSIDGNSAGRLTADRYGVLHDPSIEPGFIKDHVREAAAAAGAAAQTLQVGGATLDLKPDALPPDTYGKVLLYAINRFAEADERPFTLHSLAEGFEEMLNDTLDRVVTLKSSITNNDLAIALQPIVQLADRSVHHYEALVRFDGGRNTAESVNLAEGVGLAHELDLVVCRQVIDIVQRGLAVGNTPKVAVNLSASSLENDLFLAAFNRLFKATPELRRLVLIEVTESMRIKNLEAAEKILCSLRDAGHRICLDDFGAGAASFPYVEALTIDWVKIDGAYVKRVLDTPRDQAILGAMVTLCRNLEVETIGEMIETEGQLWKLQQLGVGYGQGYLFGRPSTELRFDKPPAARARSWSGPRRRPLSGAA